MVARFFRDFRSGLGVELESMQSSSVLRLRAEAEVQEIISLTRDPQGRFLKIEAFH